MSNAKYYMQKAVRAWRYGDCSCWSLDLDEFRRGLKNLQYLPPLILSKRKWDKYVVRGGFTSADLKVDRSAFRELMLAALSRYHCRLVAAAVAGISAKSSWSKCSIEALLISTQSLLRTSLPHRNLDSDSDTSHADCTHHSQLLLPHIHTHHRRHSESLVLGGNAQFGEDDRDTGAQGGATQTRENVLQTGEFLLSAIELRAEVDPLLQKLTAKMTQIEKRFGYLTHQLQVSRDLKSGFAEQSDTQPNPPKSSLL